VWLKELTLQNMGDAITVPIIVRLQGTNAAIAKELIDNSGMPILSAVDFKKQLTK
jgi:succinyl-CoA synthetase beta subunit